jgi:2'-5' RNA ligase
MQDQDLTTVVMLIPPHEVQALAVPILRKYAPDTLTRVPAHLTVLYPFVAFEQLDTACAVLRTICAHTAPFDVTMSGYDSFPGVAFMTPLDPSPIESLFQRIFAQFPECPPYDGAFGNDLHPHMTVGEFHSEAKQRGALLPYYAPITFRAEKVHIMFGIEGRPLPWITYDVIPLGG